MMSEHSEKQSLRLKILLFVDILMISLVFIDLLFIAFDSLFDVKIIREQVFMYFFPAFSNWYELHIAHNFLFYESSIFITIFITELLIRWVLAIVHKTYDKWFFYPIFHWYDVLGCIPTSSFRILRFIRVFVLLYRLHRKKIINLNDYALYRHLVHYYNIIVEEISDRVAVNLLEEAKSEIKRGEPIVNVIISEVLQPYKHEISEWASSHIRSGINRHYSEHRKEFQIYLKQIIKKTVDSNKEVSSLEKIPVVGAAISDKINKAVADITFGVIDRISYDLASEDKAIISDSIVSAILEIIFAAGKYSDKNQKQLANQLVTDSVDLIIERVKEKKWKMKEMKIDDPNEAFY
jgi:hypothetical protein